MKLPSPAPAPPLTVGDGSLYAMYQWQLDMSAAMRAGAGVVAQLCDPTRFGRRAPSVLWPLGAASELLAHSAPTHKRPAFGIDQIDGPTGVVEVTERTVLDLPFASLLHFEKSVAAADERVLVVAPLAGHFSTLLRDTVRTLLTDHDVFVVDWANARDVDPSVGAFGLDAYLDHLIQCIERVGPGAHVMAVCQPCVPVLAAVAVMADGGSPCQPLSMTLMAGPVDVRASPTKVNEFARSYPIEWFERHLVTVVPQRYVGGGRRVYPGFMQLGGFLGMNPIRHLAAHGQLFDARAIGDTERANATRAFYDEYFAVMDLPADFYLETVERVFQRNLLAIGEFAYRGRLVDPRAIRTTALLTIEGERDDVCGVGQTFAANELCENIPPELKFHYLQGEVGHYGVFSGHCWRDEIYPVVRDFVRGAARSQDFSLNTRS
jgi:poly(3-hydroxybutyrate) depolymerase